MKHTLTALASALSIGVSGYTVAETSSISTLPASDTHYTTISSHNPVSPSQENGEVYPIEVFNNIEELGNTQLILDISEDIVSKLEESEFSKIMAVDQPTIWKVTELLKEYAKKNYPNRIDYQSLTLKEGVYEDEKTAAAIHLGIMIKLDADMGIGKIEDNFPIAFIPPNSSEFDPAEATNYGTIVAWDPSFREICPPSGGCTIEPDTVVLTPNLIGAFFHEAGHKHDNFNLSDYYILTEQFASIYDASLQYNLFGMEQKTGGYNPSALFINSISKGMNIDRLKSLKNTINSYNDFTILLGNVIFEQMQLNPEFKEEIETMQKEAGITGTITSPIAAGYLASFFYLLSIPESSSYLQMSLNDLVWYEKNYLTSYGFTTNLFLNSDRSNIAEYIVAVNKYGFDESTINDQDKLFIFEYLGGSEIITSALPEGFYEQLNELEKSELNSLFVSNMNNRDWISFFANPQSFEIDLNRTTETVGDFIKTHKSSALNSYYFEYFSNIAKTNFRNIINERNIGDEELKYIFSLLVQDSFFSEELISQSFGIDSLISFNERILYRLIEFNGNTDLIDITGFGDYAMPLGDFETKDLKIRAFYFADGSSYDPYYVLFVNKGDTQWNRITIDVGEVLELLNNTQLDYNAYLNTIQRCRLVFEDPRFSYTDLDQIDKAILESLDNPEILLEEAFDRELLTYDALKDLAINGGLPVEESEVPPLTLEQ